MAASESELNLRDIADFILDNRDAALSTAAGLAVKLAYTKPAGFLQWVATVSASLGIAYLGASAALTWGLIAEKAFWVVYGVLIVFGMELLPMLRDAVRKYLDKKVGNA